MSNKILEIINNINKYLANFRVYWAPITMAHQYFYNKRQVTYDKHLIRTTYQKEEKLLLRKNFVENESIIFMGSSAAMGCFSTEDKFTLPSQLSTLLDRPVVNMGNPGSVILQNCLMLASLLSRYSTDILSPKTVIFYGFYNELGMLAKPNPSVLFNTPDFVHYDLRSPFHLAGHRSKFTNYINSLLDRFPDKSKKSYGYKEVFSFLQSEYYETFTDLGMYEENFVYKQACDIIYSKIGPKQIDELYKESISNSLVSSIELISNIPELNQFLLKPENFEPLYKIIYLNLEPSLAILSYLEKKYRFKIYIYVQPNLFSCIKGTNINPIQFDVADRVLSLRSKFVKNSIGHSIDRVIENKLIDRLSNDIKRSGISANFSDLNQNNDLKTHLKYSNDIVFCDEIHMTDEAFNLMARILKRDLDN